MHTSTLLLMLLPALLTILRYTASRSCARGMVKGRTGAVGQIRWQPLTRPSCTLPHCCHSMPEQGCMGGGREAAWMPMMKSRMTAHGARQAQKSFIHLMQVKQNARHDSSKGAQTCMLLQTIPKQAETCHPRAQLQCSLHDTLCLSISKGRDTMSTCD